MYKCRTRLVSLIRGDGLAPPLPTSFSDLLLSV